MLLLVRAIVLNGSSIATRCQTILYRKSVEKAAFLPGSQDISNFLGARFRNLNSHNPQYAHTQSSHATRKIQTQVQSTVYIYPVYVQDTH